MRPLLPRITKKEDNVEDDEAFLAKIAADPGEDTTRLVYADWLEESGDTDRARLLRATAAYAAAFRTIREIVPRLAATEGGNLWMVRSMGGFSVVITAYKDKVRCIKAIRDATGYELAQAKWAAEHLPQRVWCTRNDIKVEDFAIALVLPEGYRVPYTHPYPSQPENYRPLSWAEAQVLASVLTKIEATYYVEPFVVPNPPPVLPPKPGEPGYLDPEEQS